MLQAGPTCATPSRSDSVSTAFWQSATAGSRGARNREATVREHTSAEAVQAAARLSSTQELCRLVLRRRSTLPEQP